MLNIDAYKEYIALSKEYKELKLKRDRIKKKLESYKNGLIEDLLSNDMNKITIDNHTAYVHKQIWAKVSDKDEAIRILKEEGYGDYVKENYNSNQISRLLRDFEEEEKEIPDSFKGIIDPIFKMELNVIKA